jgi:hypothetical protein
MPIIVRVGSLGPDVPSAKVDPFDSWREDDLVRTTQRNHWKVYSYVGGHWAMGWDFRSYEHILLGNGRCVAVRGELLKFLEDSEVERAFTDILSTLVDRLLLANDGSLDFTPEGHTLSAEQLRFWVGQLSILSVQLNLAMYGAEAT